MSNQMDSLMTNHSKYILWNHAARHRHSNRWISEWIIVCCCVLENWHHAAVRLLKDDKTNLCTFEIGKHLCALRCARLSSLVRSLVLYQVFACGCGLKSKSCGAFNFSFLHDVRVHVVIFFLPLHRIHFTVVLR